MVTPIKSPFAAIPEIGDDMASFKRALETLKQDVEVLMGQRGPAGTANQVIIYRQIEGTAQPVGLNNGDQWWQPPVLEGEDWQLSLYWRGKWTRL